MGCLSSCCSSNVKKVETTMSKITVASLLNSYNVMSKTFVAIFGTAEIALITKNPLYVDFEKDFTAYCKNANIVVANQNLPALLNEVMHVLLNNSLEYTKDSFVLLNQLIGKNADVKKVENIVLMLMNSYQTDKKAGMSTLSAIEATAATAIASPQLKQFETIAMDAVESALSIVLGHSVASIVTTVAEASISSVTPIAVVPVAVAPAVFAPVAPAVSAPAVTAPAPVVPVAAVPVASVTAPASS